MIMNSNYISIWPWTYGKFDDLKKLCFKDINSNNSQHAKNSINENSILSLALKPAIDKKYIYNGR